MAYKFEIRDTHFLIVTDTTIADPVESIVLDMPKADAYFDHRQLKFGRDNAYIYDKNDTSTDGAKMFLEPLAECQDDTGAAFTKDSFITWMRTNTGFKQASGSGALPWLYSATNYTELSTIIAPAANEGELAIVYNSQGVWLVNRKLKGVYIYQSGVWTYANQELQDRLAAKLDSVSGDGVDNTDPLNPVLSFPTPAEIGAKPDFLENTAFNKNFGDEANEVLEGDTINTAYLWFENGTTVTPLTQNVWEFFAMTGATLDTATLKRFSQLAGFPDTLVYDGLKNVSLQIIASFGLRRSGAGQNTYQMRMVVNGVQVGGVKQFELSNVDGSITMPRMANLDENDQVWFEIRNITDNDDVILLTASITVK